MRIKVGETNNPKLFRRHLRLVVSAVLLLVFGTILVLLVSGTLKPFKIAQNSMQPTLHPNDWVMTALYEPDGPGPQHGDIVIMYDPIDPSSGEFLVKRVVALPNEKFEIREADGALYVNDELVPEPYIKEPPIYYTERPLRVRDGHYLVLGDNRNRSEDSAVWGRSIPREVIISKVIFIYRPLSRFGSVK